LRSLRDLDETALCAAVSTGALPTPEQVRALLRAAYDEFKNNDEGTTSAVYPALERADPDRFGICVVGARGKVYEIGDTTHPFTVMSVSKPFVFALVGQELGAEETRARLGANATGLPFNSIVAVDRAAGGRTNPMVNPGAIATTALAPGTTAEEK
jgi:glutaminase